MAAEVTAAGGEGRSVVCDVGDEASVRATLDEVVASAGHLDGVVHNATSGESSQSGAMTDVTVEDLEDHVRVATRGLYLLAPVRVPAARGEPRLVRGDDVGGRVRGKRLLAPYAMVKAQQRALVTVLAREWGPAGVRGECRLAARGVAGDGARVRLGPDAWRRG